MDMKTAMFGIKKTLISRLPNGEDLLSSLESIARSASIGVGVFSIIGAVSCATFGYYDQKQKQYITLKRVGKYEVLSCFGNLSQKESKHMAHAHIIFGDEKGATFGGHLMSPTKIFAAELYLQELEGEQLVRQYDEKTGLYLWT
jgi:predicted DNA-binding protein with PD1-like motif